MCNQKHTVCSQTHSCRIWLERAAPLRPGATATLKVQLRTWRGETETKDVSLQILLKVMDSVRGAGITTVGIAAKADKR